MHVAPDKRPLDWPEDFERTPPFRRIVQWPEWGTMTVRRFYIEALGELCVRWSQLSLTGTKAEPGVACYFDAFGYQCVLPCDAYAHPDMNLMALVKAFRGFAALRKSHGDAALRTAIDKLRIQSKVPDWCAFYGFSEIPERSVLEKAHKRLVFTAHPDRGGTLERMQDINAMIEQARSYYSKIA